MGGAREVDGRAGRPGGRAPGGAPHAGGAAAGALRCGAGRALALVRAQQAWQWEIESAVKAARPLALCCCRSARCRTGCATGGGVLAEALAHSILKSVVQATRLQVYLISAQSRALASADAAAAGALLCAAGSTLTVVGQVSSRIVDGRYLHSYIVKPRSDQHALMSMSLQTWCRHAEQAVLQRRSMAKRALLHRQRQELLEQAEARLT